MGLKEIGVSKLGSATDEGESTQHPPSPTKPRGGVVGGGEEKRKECIFRLQSPFPQNFVPHSRKTSCFQADPAWARLWSLGHLMPQCQQECLRTIIRGATVRWLLHGASMSPHSEVRRAVGRSTGVDRIWSGSQGP